MVGMEGGLKGGRLLFEQREKVDTWKDRDKKNQDFRSVGQLVVTGLGGSRDDGTALK